MTELPSSAATPVDGPQRRRTADDIERIRRIADLPFDDPDVAAHLRAIVEEARQWLEIEVALVSLVLDSSQIIAAESGLEGTELGEIGGTPLDWSLCVNAVERDDAFVVADATEDPVLATSPLVTEGTLRSYLGVPLHTSDGTPVGAVCVLGPRARGFTTDELAKLSALRDRAERIITAAGDGSG